jgi:hypothetical protein
LFLTQDAKLKYKASKHGRKPLTAALGPKIVVGQEKERVKLQDAHDYEKLFLPEQ